MTPRLALVLVTLLLLAPTLVPGPAAAQDDDQRQASPVDTLRLATPAWNGSFPVPHDRTPRWIPQDAHVTYRIALQARHDLQDTLEVESDDLDVWPRTVPVDLAAGEGTSIRVHVANASGARTPFPTIWLTLPNTTWLGHPVSTEADLRVLPPLAVEALAPQALAQDASERTGSPENEVLGPVGELPVRVRVTNPSLDPAPAREIRLVDQRDRPIAAATVPPLGPRASVEVDVATLTFDMLEEADVHIGPGSLAGRVGLTLQVGDMMHHEAPPLYRWTNGTATVQHDDSFQVDLRRGIDARVTATHVVPHEPSWVRLELVNRGPDDAPGLDVDVRVHPWPPTGYGPGTVHDAHRTASLDAGETQVLNVSFTPRVSGPHRVTVTSPLPDRSFRFSTVVPVASPLTIHPEDRVHREVDVGDTHTLALRLNATEALEDATLRIVATTPFTGSGPWSSDDLPFTRFVTSTDLVDAGTVPVDLEPGAPRVVEVDVQAPSAGRIVLVPLVETGDALHMGTGPDPRADDGMDLHELFHVDTRTRHPETASTRETPAAPPGFVALTVAPHPMDALHVWVPVVLLGAVLAGGSLWRRRLVR